MISTARCQRRAVRLGAVVAVGAMLLAATSAKATSEPTATESAELTSVPSTEVSSSSATEPNASSAPEQPSATSEGSESESSIASDDDLAAKIAQYEDAASFDFEALMPEGEVAPNPGMRIAIITAGLGAGQVPFHLPPLEEAAEALGWETQVFDGQLQAQVQGSLIQQAVQEQYDGIVLIAVNPVAVPTGISAAMDAGIPIVCQTGCYQDNNGIVDVGTSPEDAGRMLGEWIALDSGGAARVHLYTSPEFPSQDAQVRATGATLEEICPDCEITSGDALVADIFAPGAPFFQAFLNDNPANDQNLYINPGYDSAALVFANTAAQLGRSDVRGVGTAGTPEFTAMIKQGVPQANVSTAFPLGFFGYASMDAMARLLAGESVEHRAYPVQLITATNADTFNPDDPQLIPEFDYVSAFKELWGAS